MKNFPYCPNRVDTKRIEDKMRGREQAEKDVADALKLVYCEMIAKLERVLYLTRQLKDGFCNDDEP